MLCVLLVFTALAILYYCLRPGTHWEERGVKHDKIKWILGGHTLRVLFRQESFPEILVKLHNKFAGSRYYGVYHFGLPVLVIKDPELIKQVAVKNFDHFSDHNKFLPDGDDPIWENNLFVLKGERWRNMRTTISPTFTSSKIKAMYILIRECAENFVDHFLKKDEDMITVELKDTFTRFTSDVIGTTAFGVNVNSLGDPNNEFYLMGRKATDLSGIVMGLKFLAFFMFPKTLKFFHIKIRLFSSEVTNFFKRIVSESIKSREEKGIVRPDLIHILMEARKGVQTQEEKGVIDTGFATTEDQDLGKGKVIKEITNDDITSQAAGFFFAGFDAVSSLMCFTAYELAVNQDVQKKLRKEIQDVLATTKGKLTYEALLKMKYLDMVVSETLRKWPNQAATDRVCTKPFTIEPTTPDEKPLHLEVGDFVWLPMYATQYDPEYYPNPERFDPERFSDENKGNIQPYTFYTFGVGPRNCLGSRLALLETKTILFYVLSNFEIVPVERSVIPLKISKKVFTLAAEDGFWFGLKRLQNKD